MLIAKRAARSGALAQPEVKLKSLLGGIDRFTLQGEIDG